jgi:hypothetical protein
VPHPAPSLRAIVYGPRPDCVHFDALRHRNNVPASSATDLKSVKKAPQRPTPLDRRRENTSWHALCKIVTHKPLSDYVGSVYVATVKGFHDNANFFHTDDRH